MEDKEGMSRLPTWDELYSWVGKKTQNEVVGFSRDMFLGPLNLYFAQTVGEAQGKYWMIGHASASVLVWDSPVKYREMYRYVSDVPQWMVDLINLCDDLADAGHTFMKSLRPITAQQFRYALERVQEGA